jgi:hypothetical protein
VTALLQGVLFIAIGAMTQSASGYFAQIVKTEGNDIANLMLALDKLRGVYSLQRVVLLVALVMITLGFILLLPRL